jgi:glycosyltransferase involved in cell wall biosynthesis
VDSAPLVSFVTPFYNTREFLAECIESVLAQTYQNWEYILVDNCSTDGSSEIAERYAARYQRKIRIVRTESFLSQVQNYNFAVSCISPLSDYCKMVQADDWLFHDCVSSMVTLAEAHPSVGIVGSYALAGEFVELDGLRYPSTEVLGRDICRLYFMTNNYVFGTPTALLMRSALIRSRVPFYEERFAPFEDAHVCFDLLRACNFGFVHQVLTYSRRENESILGRIGKFGFMRFCRLALVVEHGKDYLSEEEYDRCLREAENQYFSALGRSALQNNGGEYWEFHRSRLASIGYSLDWRLLSKWIALATFEYVGNPKHTWDRLWARRRRSRKRLSAVVDER